MHECVMKFSPGWGGAVAASSGFHNLKKNCKREKIYMSLRGAEKPPHEEFEQQLQQHTPKYI